MSRSRSQARINYSKKQGSLSRRGKVGYSEEFLDKMDGAGSRSYQVPLFPTHIIDALLSSESMTFRTCYPTTAQSFL